MRIQILCRGSTEEGLGHLFRAAAFAAEAAKSHQVQVLAVAPQKLDSLFTEIGEITRLIDDEALLPELVRTFRPDVAVIDMTSMPPHILSAVKSAAGMLACISPVFDGMAQIDLYASRIPAPNAGPDTVSHAGLDYTIFNAECRPIPDAEFESSLADGPLQTAICMGGSDSFNKTLHVLSALTRAREPGLFWVLLGNAYNHKHDQLMDCIALAPHHEIILARTNRSMWRIMRNCALSVVPGGLSFIEAVYAGLPTVSLFENDWHRQALSNLLEKGVTEELGGISVANLKKLPDLFDDFSRNRDKLRDMRRRSRGLIDGKGAARVLAAIEGAAAGGRRKAAG
jgi:spore coat polysaccharide biosynthesis predicted glycosyltransferase SpsG